MDKTWKTLRSVRCAARRTGNLFLVAVFRFAYHEHVDGSPSDDLRPCVAGADPPLADAKPRQGAADLQTKSEALVRVLHEMRSAAVALSGGIDSTVVAKA